MSIILNIDHVQLAAPKQCEEEARAYFKGILEMDEDPKPEGLLPRGGCWFKAGQARVHVGVEEPANSQKKAHPALGVTDIDVVANRLRAGGYQVLWDASIPNIRRFYSEDPFGNRIEFVQR